MSQIMSDKAAEPVGPYPHARRVGRLLFLSGIGPRKRGSQDIPGVELGANGQIVSYDFEKQFHSMMENIKNVLAASDATLRQIVDVQVFLTDMKTDFQKMNKVYAEYFAEIGPTRTTVEVGALPTPIAVELKVIVDLDADKS
ncbi:MAG: RidA family protein [Bdellovibrionales bacterium]|nr:RidA family protein [Bdellovibrionales bacterium]